MAVGAPLAAKADNGIVDVRALPRLEGAVEDTARTQSYSLSYGVPTVVAVTTAADQKAARRRRLGAIFAAAR